MKELMVETAAGRLYSCAEGPADAPAIVLSHSLGANLAMWDPQMQMLTRHRRVIRYDTRGHGASDTPPGPWSFDDLVADALVVMDAHGVARADFLGLSLGGMTGLGLGLAHPDRLERLIVADARADAPEPFRANWDTRIAKIRAGGLEAIADATLESWFTAEWRRDNPGTVAEIRAMIRATDPEGYLHTCATLKTLDYLRALGDLRVPALFLCGEHDAGAPADAMRAMAAAAPDGRFELVPRAAHVANINNPADFNAAVAAFLDLAGEGA